MPRSRSKSKWCGSLPASGMATKFYPINGQANNGGKSDREIIEKTSDAEKQARPEAGAVEDQRQLGAGRNPILSEEETGERLAEIVCRYSQPSSFGALCVKYILPKSISLGAWIFLSALLSKTGLFPHHGLFSPDGNRSGDGKGSAVND